MGRTGDDCRGDEHEVELVWSLISGKTRVYWNRRNLSNVFNREIRSDRATISWHTQKGELLRVVAHAQETPGVTQYDLLIDGESFSRMSGVAELGRRVPARDSSGFNLNRSEASNSNCDSPEMRIQSVNVHSLSDNLGSSEGELDSLHSFAERHPYDGMGFRLSMVGLNCGLAEVDELHSEVYSTMLESLRYRIVECLPQTEEMVSRSIIQTFFPDYASQHSLDILSSKSGSSEEREPQQIEVDALCGAYEWARLDKSEPAVSASLLRPNVITPQNRAHSAPPAARSEPIVNPEDGELVYMQKLIDSIFIKVRNEDISSDEGARILLGVAAVLRLDFTNPFPMDTVLLDGLDPCITPEDLVEALSEYGDLEAVGIASKQPSFGFCRFMSEEGFRRFLEASDSVEIGGVQPRVIPLSENMHSTMADCSTRDSSFNEERRDLSPTPMQLNIRGSQSTIPHLMGAWTDDDAQEDPLEPIDMLGAWTDDDAQEDPTVPMVVTPDHQARETISSRVCFGSPRSSLTDLEDLVPPVPPRERTCSF